MTEFKKYKLGDICDLNKNSLKVSDTFDTIEYLDTSSITENTIDSFQNFSREDAPSRAQRKVQNETIIFSTVRPNQNHFGLIQNPKTNLIVSSGFTTLDVKDKIEFDAKYLYYNLTQPSVVNFLQTLAQNSVSAYPSINPDDIGNLYLRFPEVSTQKKIASVLSNIDRKISVNREINRNLEELAKQIYNYWFVQFDFPNEEGKPYKSSGGKMVYNEVLKREIPAGWEIKKISSQIKENIGGDWGKEEPEGNYQLKVSCCRGADLVSMTDLPTRYILNSNSYKLLEEDDMIVEISGGSPTQATGRCVLISKEILNSFNNKLICSNFCQALSISDKDYVSYFYYMWKMFYNSDVFFNFEGKTSGIKNFQYDTFVAEKWYFPPKDLAKKFKEIVSQNYMKKCALDQENKHLAALRDELLPLLMNGQVTLNSCLSLIIHLYNTIFARFNFTTRNSK